jgi:sugar diacid utilization regulator
VSEHLKDLSLSDIRLILSFAANNMRIAATAEAVGLDKTTVYRRLLTINKRSRLDPRNFRDLCMLVSLIEAGEDGTDTG